MIARNRPLVLLPIVFVLLACGIFSPRVASPTPLATETNRPSATLTSTPSATPSPIPSFTPTSIPPSLTPTPPPTASPTSTPLPRGVQLSIFKSLWNIVNDTYVYPDFNGLDWEAIQAEYRRKITAGLSSQEFYTAMSDLIDQLGDDHSSFLDPAQVEEEEAAAQGEYDYVGIGILASAVPERQRAVILAVFPGGPAEAAGLQMRDSIISVDGTPILDEQGYLRDIVRGPEGTSINILIQTPGEQTRQVQITRRRITGNNPVFHTVITSPNGKRIGYIYLLTFLDDTVDEQVGQALQEMTADAPLDGLILDNRMNTGGSSTVFEPVLGYFIGGKLGDYVRHSDLTPLVIRLHDIKGSAQVPLVVLVGPDTVSYGEIFSGILQDTGRAYVIGTTTDGNVEVLWSYDFEDGSQLWLANETFRPLNHPDANWEKTGIIPDLTVSGGFDEFTMQDDPLIIAGIKYLSDQ